MSIFSRKIINFVYFPYFVLWKHHFNCYKSTFMHSRYIPLHQRYHISSLCFCRRVLEAALERRPMLTCCRRKAAPSGTRRRRRRGGRTRAGTLTRTCILSNSPTVNDCHEHLHLLLPLLDYDVNNGSTLSMTSLLCAYIFLHGIETFDRPMILTEMYRIACGAGLLNIMFSLADLSRQSVVHVMKFLHLTFYRW